MRISDWSSDVCSSDLGHRCRTAGQRHWHPPPVQCARPAGHYPRIGFPPSPRCHSRSPRARHQGPAAVPASLKRSDIGGDSPDHPAAPVSARLSCPSLPTTPPLSHPPLSGLLRRPPARPITHLFPHLP